MIQCGKRGLDTLVSTELEGSDEGVGRVQEIKTIDLFKFLTRARGNNSCDARLPFRQLQNSAVSERGMVIYSPNNCLHYRPNRCPSAFPRLAMPDPELVSQVDFILWVLFRNLSHIKKL